MTYEKVEAQSQDQSCADGVEGMLLHRRKVTSALIDLDRCENENVKDYSEQEPESLPKAGGVTLLRVVDLNLMGMKALRLRSWRHEKMDAG